MCKYCENFKIDIAWSQVLPILGFNILLIKSRCKICDREFIADFEKHQLCKAVAPVSFGEVAACKFCSHYRIDIATRQVCPTVGFDILLIKSSCKICHREFIANFEEHELSKKLLDIGVKSHYFSLHGQLKPCAIIMDEIYGKWVVFYFDERGNRDFEKEFKNETEACQYVYDLLKNDSAARR